MTMPHGRITALSREPCAVRKQQGAKAATRKNGRAKRPAVKCFIKLQAVAYRRDSGISVLSGSTQHHSMVAGGLPVIS